MNLACVINHPCSSLSAQLSGATVDYSSARTPDNLIRSSLDKDAGGSGTKSAALIDVDGSSGSDSGVETVRIFLYKIYGLYGTDCKGHS